MDRIDDYRILRRLGSGGFGEVWLGLDERIDQQVAIKVFRPKDENLVAVATSSDTEGLQVLRDRFVREAKILAGLEDAAHVVNVLRFGELEDGAPWYAMPYLPGSLADRLGRDVFDARAVEELAEAERPRPLPIEAALPVLHQLLEGLAAAHAQGLIHRDIKPSNVLLTAAGVVRVADFGIAKAPDGQHSTVSQLGMGSRNYMAPEQRESAKHVDARADVYAVGILAYRMITGRLPVGRFSDPDVHQPALGAAVNAVLLKAMEVDPDARYADAGAMLAALQVAEAQGSAPGDDATGTGTVVSGEAPRLRNELSPLRDAIREQLRAWGEVDAPARNDLHPLAELVGLNDADFDVLVTQVAEAEQATIVPLQRFVAMIDRRLAGGAVGDAERNALDKAGTALGLAPDRIEALIERRRRSAAVVGDGPADDGTAPADVAATHDSGQPQESKPARAPRATQTGEPGDERSAAAEPGVQAPPPTGTRGRARRAVFLLAGLAVLGAAAWVVFHAGPDRFTGGSDATVSAPTPSEESTLAAPQAGTAAASAPVLGGGTAILVVESDPAGAEVAVAGEAAGITPLERTDIADGSHAVRIAAEDHEPLVLEGETFETGKVTRIERALTRGRGDLTVLVEPRDAWIEFEGERLAEGTPVTLEDLPAGEIELRIGAPDHEARTVSADVPMNAIGTVEATLGDVAYGTLTLEVTPADAEIVLPDIGPSYTPGMRLAEGVYRVQVGAPGHEAVERRVVVDGATRSEVDLARSTSMLTIEVIPEYAEIRVTHLNIEGQRVTRPYVPNMEVAAGEFAVEATAPGFVPYASVASTEGFRTALKFEMEPAEEAGLVSRDRPGSGSGPPEMVLLRPSPMTMGASRRSPGRRSNETVRDVELVRPYLLSATEVTNGEFRDFSAEHDSDTFEQHDLDGDDLPVVNVSWTDAALYSNWLSRREGLGPVYRVDGERIVGVDFDATGYRLPTEAEWAWAARYGPDQRAITFAWGETLRPPRGFANIADESAEGLLPRLVPDYTDGYPVSAPSGSFAPNANGIHDLGGNVAEWVNDFYRASPGSSVRGPTSGEARVIRGPGWMHGTRVNLRLSFRDYGTEGRRDVGFRVARWLAPPLADAGTYFERARARDDAGAALETVIAHPVLLAEDAILLTVRDLLGKVTADSKSAARLSRQIEAVSTLVSRARVPVEVDFRSDGVTEVIETGFGSLGQFREQNLELPPGHYLAIGRRSG